MCFFSEKNSFSNTYKYIQINFCNFVDDILECIFLNENARISIKTSLKFVPKIQNNPIPALFQIMAWHRSRHKSLSELMIDYWRKYASLGLSGLTSYFHSSMVFEPVQYSTPRRIHWLE